MDFIHFSVSGEFSMKLLSTKLSKIRAGLLSAVVLATSFTAVPAHAEPTPHASHPSITELDLVAFDAGGTLWAYSSDPRIPDAPLTRRQIGSGWTAMKDLKVADWNQDQVLDIVAVGKNGLLYVYYGELLGGFTRTIIGSGWGSYDISVGKWKETDIFPSIIAANLETGILYNYPNLSGAGLAPRVVEGRGWGNSITHHLTDWEGDGRADLLGQRMDTGDMLLYRTDGNGNFTSEPRAQVGRGWNTMNTVVSVTADTEFTGLYARSHDGILYYYGIRNGEWHPPFVIGTGWNGYTIAG